MATSHPANRSRRREPRLLFRWSRLGACLGVLALGGCVSQAEHAALQAQHDALELELKTMTELNAAQHRIIVNQERELESRQAEAGASPAAGEGKMAPADDGETPPAERPAAD